MYNHMILSKLFYGGKIIGAGGGGFFLMVLKNENKAIKFLNRNKLRFTRIKFHHLGAKMIN